MAQYAIFIRNKNMEICFSKHLSLDGAKQMLTFLARERNILLDTLRENAGITGSEFSLYISDDQDMIQNASVSSLRNSLTKTLADRLLSTPCENVIEGVYERV